MFVIVNSSQSINNACVTITMKIQCLQVPVKHSYFVVGHNVILVLSANIYDLASLGKTRPTLTQHIKPLQSRG